jgi:hypothetical protein
MKRILPTDPPIPNTIDREAKRALKERSIVSHEHVVFDLHDESWTRDGREDSPVSATLVGSIILSHDTDNRSDEAPDSHFEGSTRDENGKRTKVKIKGNPVIWGSLSSVQLTVMGTNEAPVLVMSASGRQTAKASEWTQGFLRRCRTALCAAHARLTAARDEAKANLDALTKRRAEVEPERLAEAQKAYAYFEGKDVYTLAVKAARAEMQAERDPVTADLLDEHFDVVFEGSKSSKLGKPMVGLTYSAAVWLSVKYGSDLPTDRHSLEKAKLANFQVPSLPSVEAESIRRLVRDYVLTGGLTEERALDKVRQFARPLMAVGVPQPASPEYVRQLYRLDMLCDEAKRAIDSERDPRKMLTLFDRLTKRLFRAGTETITVGEREFVLAKNEMDETEQRALLAPRQPTERAPRKPTAAVPALPANDVLVRLSAMRSPMSVGLSEQQRDQARAVWAWEAYRAGNPDALRDFPHLLAVLSPTKTEEEEDEETPLSMAIDAVDHWNGRDKKIELPDFAEREPKDDAKIPAWNARKAKHEATVKAAQALIDAARAKMPATVKPDMRPAWLHDELTKE